jgi:hypothetical protein
MKVKSLDGKEHPWNLGQYVGKRKYDCSAIHEQTRDFLAEQFPALQILEEVFIPKERLYLDFYIPVKKLAVECQGIQHDKHSIFFHKTKMDFLAAQANDRRKHDWCQLNGIKLIYFYPKEDVETWQQKLSQ